MRTLAEAIADTDARGVVFINDVEEHEVDQLPFGWDYCPTCKTAWNDQISTSVTPTPAARCPFEYTHKEA